jgi:hydroxyacyl-ACP dehydratase HTD2-like protein with hotdog domain
VTTVTEQLYFDDVTVGDTVPPLVLTVEPVQMFFFSAATYNGHRIHYDRAWAQQVEGYEDLLVQGPLQVALMARVITDWIGGQGRLIKYAVQNRASAFAGEELTFTAAVTGTRPAEGSGEVDLALEARKTGDVVLLPGTATVLLPRKEGR